MADPITDNLATKGDGTTFKKHSVNDVDTPLPVVPLLNDILIRNTLFDGK
jgi:hypothetical protein